MGHFSIKDLEHLSGIKAHTIRIWEQRYNIIKPKRTESNIRFYDNKDLKQILNISLLNDHGFKISRIAQMSPESILQEVLAITARPCNYNDQVQALTMSMYELDELRFEKIIATNVLHHGFEKTMTQIVYPFLVKVGVLWQTGAACPVCEHFITCLIRQKLIVAIDGLVFERKAHTKKFFLFLPEGELHELGLLFAHYLIKARQHQVVYLGQSVPLEELLNMYTCHQPDYIFTLITSSPSQPEVQNYLYQLSTAFANSQVLVSGFQVVEQPNLDIPSNVKVMPRFDSLIEMLS